MRCDFQPHRTSLGNYRSNILIFIQSKLEIIEEICQRYDVDGFELDYIRHPILFSRRLRGESCTPDEAYIITSMMERIRKLTEIAAKRRGRSLLISARVPDTFTTCLDNGMDVEAWLERDLIDILADFKED